MLAAKIHPCLARSRCLERFGALPRRVCNDHHILTRYHVVQQEILFGILTMRMQYQLATHFVNQIVCHEDTLLSFLQFLGPARLSGFLSYG